MNEAPKRAVSEPYDAQFVGGPLDGYIIRVSSDGPLDAYGEDVTTTYEHTDGPFWEPVAQRPTTADERVRAAAVLRDAAGRMEGVIG